MQEKVRIDDLLTTSNFSLSFELNSLDLGWLTLLVYRVKQKPKSLTAWFYETESFQVQKFLENHAGDLVVGHLDHMNARGEIIANAEWELVVPRSKGIVKNYSSTELSGPFLKVKFGIDKIMSETNQFTTY